MLGSRVSSLVPDQDASCEQTPIVNGVAGGGSGTMAAREKPCLHLCGNSKARGAVDVVFVHGLTGDYRETWTAKKKKTAKIFWPDALVKELGDRVNMAIFAQPPEKVHSSNQLARAWGTGRWSTA